MRRSEIARAICTGESAAVCVLQEGRVRWCGVAGPFARERWEPIESSPTALCAAVDLARRCGASLHLLHVIDLPAFAYGSFGSGPALAPAVPLPHLRERALQALRAAADAVDGPPAGIEPHVVEGGRVAEQIREAAAELDADLIIMGTHGRTGLAHLLLGSVAERTVRRVPCPVLTVRAPDEGEGAPL